MSIDGKQQLEEIARTHSIEPLLINNDLVTSLINDDIVQYLTLNIICDFEVELFLTCLRKTLLILIAGNNIAHLNSDNLNFLLFVLSRQCFNTEYVFYVSQQEENDLEKLNQLTIKNTESLVWPGILIISCYQQIESNKNILHIINSTNNLPNAIQNIIQYQIQNTQIETEIKNSIKAIGVLPDDITQTVKHHYETNPYPRWFEMPEVLPETIEHFASRSLSKDFSTKFNNSNPENLLVIGCGTGWLCIEHAKRFPKSNIISIDLSLSSLAYAKRKAMEYEIDNIEFFQMDLMQLEQLEMNFDFIDCIGVLSHVSDPREACELFISRLSTQGIVRFSLYSRLGRRLIREAADYVHKNKYTNTADSIRKLRHHLVEREGFRKLIENKDFYYMSGVRDLFFHDFENGYDLLYVQNMLNEFGADLLGLELADNSVYEQHIEYSNTSFDELGGWHEFEQKHPDTFQNDYVVWLQKNG